MTPKRKSHSKKTIFSFVDKEERLEKKTKIHRLDEDKLEGEKPNDLNTEQRPTEAIHKVENKEEKSYQQASAKVTEAVSIRVSDSEQQGSLKTAEDKQKKEAGMPKEELDRNSMLRQSRLKAMSMKLHSSQGLEELERQPAYMRKGLKLDDPEQINPDKEVSRYSLKDQQSGLNSSNSFLHDNVD